MPTPLPMPTLQFRLGVLETCCIIGTWVQDHLLREAWPGPLGVPPVWGIEGQGFPSTTAPGGLTALPGSQTASPCVAPP
jgi:hypothetical protein